MTYTEERKRQIVHEINWLKEKLKTARGQRHRKDLQRQIDEREYNLHLGVFEKQNLNAQK